MVKVTVQNGVFQINGTFNFGYMGLYKDEAIQILDSVEEVKDWEIISEALDTDNCSNDDIAEFLTNYMNTLEDKIQKNIKQLNNNFLMRVFADMESCGSQFWKHDELTVREHMPDNPDDDIYPPNYEAMTELENEYEDSPNDGSVDKTDVEFVLRKLFPMFDLDNFINGIEPEAVCLSDEYISFQCSDKFNHAVLCSAYDELDSELRFTDWHNF